MGGTAMKPGCCLIFALVILISALFVAPATARDAFVVGNGGTMLRDSLNTWVPMPSGTVNHLWAIHGIDSDDIFAVGQNGTILHYDGATWSPMTSGTTWGLHGVWGCLSNYVFAVGSLSGLLQYNGVDWNFVDPLPDVTWYYATMCVWGAAVNDVFVTAFWSAGMYDETTLILHYDCVEWTVTGDVYGEIRDIWGSSGDNVYAVGYEDTGGGMPPTEYIMLHYDGIEWSYVMHNGSPHDWPFLQALWGSAEDDIFAVGFDGAIMHYDGIEWSEMTSGTTEALVDVWGCAGDDVYAVGTDGTILHYDGAEWDTTASGTTTHLKGIWCIGDVAESDAPMIPFSLHQNYPNPFNPTTTIRFDLPHAVHVELCVYNVKGELIATLVNQHLMEGRKEVTWSAKDNRGRAVSSGIYFYRLVAGDFVQTKKMVLLR
jgi:hypothetical protein